LGERDGLVVSMLSGGSRGGKSGHGPHRSCQWSFAPPLGGRKKVIRNFGS